MFFLGQLLLPWFLCHRPVHPALLLGHLLLEHGALQGVLVVLASGTCPLLVGAAFHLAPRLHVHLAFSISCYGDSLFIRGVWRCGLVSFPDRVVWERDYPRPARRGKTRAAPKYARPVRMNVCRELGSKMTIQLQDFKLPEQDTRLVLFGSTVFKLKYKMGSVSERSL